MTLEQLLAELTATGVSLRKRGSELMIRTSGEVDPVLVGHLRHHKTTLLELVDGEGDDWWTPPPVITPEMLPLVDLTAEEIERIVRGVPGGAANVQDIYPLAPLQEGILFHHLIAAGGDPYLLSCTYRFASRERVDAYLKALDDVIHRHDILRTAFVWEGLSAPVQVVLRRVHTQVEEIELDAHGGDALEQLRRRFDPRRCRIDIGQAPLLRAHVAYDAAQQSWLLLLLSHHLVNDHTTLARMQEEIQAHLLGCAHELPAPVPFRNYVAQARLGTTAEEHNAFFRRMLGDVDEPTAPFGLIEVQGDGSGIEVGYVDVDPIVSRRLREQARRLGVSAASLCHLAWALVLARVSGRNDVVFGTVLLGRLQGYEGAALGMGLFMNTLPLRIQVGEESVEASVWQTHVLLAELLRHEHASLVLAQRCSRIPAPLPLFSALLNYRHNAAVTAESADAWAGIEAIYGEERTNYPLVLSIDDLGDGFGLNVQVQSGIGALRVCSFVHTALERLTDALERSPDVPSQSVDVLPPVERDRLIEGWNATEQEFPDEACIHELFEAQVAKTPDAVAVVDDTRTVTYRELNAEANQLAHHLLTLGVTPDRRVALCMERSVEVVVGLLAVLKAGGAYVPLDPWYPAERLRQMLDDCDPVAVLTQGRLSSVVAESCNGRAVLDLTSAAPVWVSEPQTNPASGVRASDLAYVIYTSGSTGMPKGVMNEHRGVVNRLVWMQKAYGLTRSDAVLQKTPYSFDVSVWEFFWPLQNGARLVMARPEGHKDARYLSEVIERERITTVHFVPSMLQVFLEHGEMERCGTLERVVCSGEALPAALAARFHEKLPHAALKNLYGPTEAAVDVTAWDCVPGAPGASVPIGRPVANTRIYILDGHGQPVPIGVAGEICIGGVQVARGYLNRPELTAERFIDDPFAKGRMYRTGDLGRYLPHGAIEFLGRNDHQVKLRGFRIELGEIEAHLLEQVKEAVVLAREDRLVAYVVGDAKADELRKYLSARLPEYMVPAAYVRLDALPLTPNGKVDRKALPAPEGTAYGARVYEAPQGEVEETVARIWEDLLRVERVGRHDNFFELGGHSLLAVTLMARLRRTGLNADVRSVFTSPTPAGLAAALGAGAENVEVPPNGIPAGCEAITPDMLPLVELSAEEIERIVSQVPGGAANVQDIYRLAPLQEGILFHHLMAKERDPYLLISELRFDSRERLDKYLSALQTVVDRHDILRTGVLWEGLSVPVQVVVRKATLPVEEVRLDSRAARLDVRQAPMLRVYVAREDEGERWVLSLLLHHLTGDHTTLEIVEQEIEAQLLGRGGELATPLPFRNFIAQARLGVSEKEHEAFFRGMLGDVEEPTAPFDLLEVQGDGRGIEEAHVAVDTALSERLRERARRLGVSAASLCHVAWAQVLARICGREDVVFGTVLFGRMHGGADADRVMGLFINTLPIRISVGDESVAVSARRTHALLAELLRHEHASLALAQRCSAVAPPAPLFSSLLNYRHVAGGAPSAESQCAWEGIESLHGHERTNYPLLLSIDDSGHTLGLSAQVDASVGAMRVCRFMYTALERLVEALDSTPETAIGKIDVLPPEERALLLDAFNETTVEPSGYACLHESFEEQVRKTPQATAATFEDRAITYDELNAQANRLAHYLRELGVAPDRRVALCVPRGIEMLVGMLATLKAGGAYVPLDPAYPVERLRGMVADSEPIVLLTEGGLETIRAGIAAGLPALELTGDAWRWANHPRTDPDRAALRPDHLAYVLYTSGSTGRPKGVMIEHRNAVNFIEWARSAYADDLFARTLFATSLNFDLAVFETFVPLSAGGTVCIATDALALARKPVDVTLINTVPSAMTALVESAAVPATVLRVNLAGEPLRETLVRRIFAATQADAVSNLYGPTETTTYSTWVTIRRGDVFAAHIGRPIANTRIYLLDPQGRPAPIGVAGEIHIGGAGVARGYLNQPELTAEKFIDDPFTKGRMYRTGDLGRYLPDGNIEFLGRNDHQVKLRGFRIELGEIEAHLLEQVKEAVVLAREDRLVAYVVGDAKADELRKYLSARLPEYMVPAAYVRLDALPLTPNGKVDRKALPAPEGAAFGARVHEAPQGEVEETVARIWEELLRVERVGRHDNFFELGGHSLLAVTLMERLRRAGLTADVRSVFTNPTLIGLAAVLGAGTENVDVPPNAIPAGCEAITPDMLPLVELSAEEIERIVSQVPGGAANVQDVYRLAPLQEGILFHHLLAKEGDPYLLISELRFDSRERLDKYLSALQTVVDRHDILRTGVLWEGLSVPVQVVVRKATLPVEEVRLDSRAARLDVRQAPMLRVYVAREDEGERWMLSLLLHHLAGDHTTLEIVGQEIEAQLLGRGGELATPLPFRNFVAQARLGVSEKEHEAFFRGMLGDVDEPTAPFGLLEVRGDGRGVEEARVEVDAALNERLRERARRLGVSAASLCHVAWAQVLARICGREDVVFGTVLFGRMHGGADADRIMGLFMNTLPVRIRVGREMVESAVRRMHTLLAELLRHEHAPLALAQRCSAVAAPMPLFSALLNYRHSRPLREAGPDARNAWDGIEGLFSRESTNYPVMLAVDDFGDSFALTAQTVDPVDPMRVCRFMSTALEQLVGALERDADATLSSLDVVPPDERSLVLQEWNDTRADFPEHACIHELFEAAAESTPDATALTFGHSVLTYRELNERANQLAHHLRDLGVGPDTRTAICVDRGIGMVAGVLAVLKAGGAYVPLDPAYPAERIALVLDDCEPVAILTDGSWNDRPTTIPRVDLNADSHLWMQRSKANPARGAITSQDLAYVIYTSGSSGRPKGVMNTHRGVVNLLWSMRATLEIDASDNVIALTTLAFDIAALELYLPLVCGARMTLLDRATSTNAEALAAAVEESGATVVQATPSTWRMLVESGWAGVADLKVLCGGEALPAALAGQIRERVGALWNVYGPTETTIWSAVERVDATTTAVVPIGRPLANTVIYVLDSDGRPAPVRVAGEIHIGGEGVARGYFRRPDLTAERFIDDPFSAAPGVRLYKTGDLGRLLPDGRIEFLGRNDFQVKLRGHRIEPGEIEARLAEHPAIREAAVLAREDAAGDKRLVAYVVPVTECDSLDREALRRHVAAHLPDYMVPAAFVQLADLPLTPNGKLDRKALPAPAADAHLSRVHEPPRGELETLVADVWGGVLGVARLSRTDDFFALGGHSLLAVGVISRLRQALGVEVALHRLFASPRLSDFARGLLDAEQSPLPPIEPAPAGERQKLSFEQQPLWLVSQLEGRSEAYHIRLRLRLGGVLDRDALRCALDALLARHEALRTTFDPHDEEPVQRIAPADEVRFALLEHDLLGGADTADELEQLAATEARAPFDLRQGPLIRGRLVRVAERDHTLLLTMHHIVSDGWSANVIARELSALYAAFRDGAANPLPPLPVQYADYAAWQRRWLGGEHLRPQEQYWRTILEGAPALLELPADRPRPPRQDYRGEAIEVVLHAELTQKLRALSRRNGVTLFMTLMAGWAALLSRMAGQDEVMIGTPTANRGRVETEGLVGFFVNTLALRIDLAGSPAVGELLRRVREQLLAAQQNQEVPFERVVALAGVARSAAYTPLFQVLFAWESASADMSELRDLELLPAPRENAVSVAAKFDLSLSLTDAGDVIAGSLEYATSLFERSTIDRLLGHWRTLLEAMVQEDGRAVDHLPLLEAAERTRLLDDWNATGAEFPAEHCIQELFEARAAETPDAVALVGERGELTYSELNMRANRLAHFLRRRGVTPDTRVAICARRGIEMIVGLLAVLKAGGAFVPLDPAYPDERLRATIEDSAAALVLTDGALEERPAVMGTVAAIDLTVPSWLDEPTTNPDRDAVGLLPSHLAYVIYTSGSTGRPKGVMIEHRGLCNLATAQIAGFGVEAGSRVLQFASFSFDACVSEVMMALCRGAALVLPPPMILAGQDLVETVERFGITHVTLPPAVLTAMPDELEMPLLRTLIVAGEALPHAVARLWQTRVRLINAYGPTETTVCATMYDCDAGDSGNPPIGRPIANTRVYILDAHGEPVPVGVTGEIHIGGVGVARGYLNRPDLTAERFVPDPFRNEPGTRMYRTGDLGRYLPDGRIEFLGRNDFQVKLRGFRIELGEIEAQLRERVREAVVLVRENRLVAYVVGDAGSEDLRHFLAARLPEYMVPAAYVRLESLPLTPNGKLDRQALPAPDGEESAAAYEAPQNELETLVTAVWAEVLERDRIGRRDDFFEIGGDSLLAVQAIWRLRQALNVEIALDGLFTHPVLADFTRELAKVRETTLPAITRAAESGRTVPSFAQQRLWFLTQLDDASTAYHIPFDLRLKGTLNVAALRRALDRLVERHEVLRTTFVSVDGQPRLRITGAAQSRFLLVEHDFTDAGAPERELETLSAQEAGIPFDLRQGPLIRGRLIRLGEQEHALLITQHHIVSDGWSMGVLLGELGTLYRAYCHGNSDPFPPLELQYADYAAWQRRTIAGDALQRQTDYWRTALTGAPALLELPVDHPRPAQQSYEGDLIECGLDCELANKVRALARRHGTTLFVTLLASWAAVLSRLSGQDDVVVGTPVANRGRAETEGLIGFFVNTLALRIDLSDSPSVGELLRRVKNQSLAAQQNQDIPFEQVVDAVRPTRSLAHSPLFQVMFSWDNTPGEIPDFEGLTAGCGPGSKSVTAKFDLTIWLAETGDTISGGIEYATSLFERSTVERFLAHWRTLLEAMVEDDAPAIERLPLLTEAERDRLIEGWNATEQEFPDEACIHELFEAQVAKTPDAVAVADDTRTVTYRELNAEANQLAHHLLTLGVTPDRRVALCMERSVEMVVGLLAVLKAGGAYVPLDPWYPAERLRQMLDDCDPVAVLTQGRLSSVVAESCNGRAVLDLTSAAPAWVGEPQTNPASGVQANDLAYVIYTSGSTGMPKGVMNEHRGVVNRLVWMQEAYGLTRSDAVLQKTPYSFDVSVWEFFWPLQNGARLVMARPEGHKDARYLSEVIERERITTVHFVPSMLQVFLEHGEMERCGTLERVVCSGEALPAALAARFHEKLPHAALKNLYGPTEAAVDVTAWDSVPGASGASVPIGRPVANTRIYILDGHGQPVPIGVAGEICIGGVQVARGYLNRPELTAEKFIDDPFAKGRMYRTGDLGRYLPDGAIEFLGRNDHQVKLRGFRIELGEIEAHLLEQVKEAVVLAREDRLVAYVVGDAKADELRKYLSARLPEYMVPAAYVRLDALPLTPNGKVDRKALPAPEGTAYGARVYEAPQGEVEETVARIWEDLLGVERVGRHDNFFELGGHSLLAVTLMERMRRQGLEADVRAVFTAPTPVGLAAATQEIEEIRL